MPVNWTNNFNDNQVAATIQFKVNGAAQNATTTLAVDEFVQTDPIDGSVNWKVGDEFEIAGVTDQLYTIEAIGFAGAAGNLTISPATKASGPADNALCSKEGGSASDSADGYAGNQGSAENHLRLRNMGII